MPNGKKAKIHNVGTIQLTHSLTLSNALHVPDFHYNLLSASKLAKQLSAYVIFSPNTCYIQDLSMKQPLAIGKEADGLYFVDHKFCNPSLTSSPTPASQFNNSSIFSFSCQMSPLELLHCRLGNMSFDNMKHIDIISSCKTKPSSICKVCHKAKQHIASFPLSTSCTTHKFEMLHVDLWGPYVNSTDNGYKYFLTIVDDFS